MFSSVSNLRLQDWIIVSLPVAKVEQLLNTEYHQYHHTDGTQVIRTTEYSLPRSLQEHIDIVAPTKSVSILRVSPVRGSSNHYSQLFW